MRMSKFETLEVSNVQRPSTRRNYLAIRKEQEGKQTTPAGSAVAQPADSGTIKEPAQQARSTSGEPMAEPTTTQPATSEPAAPAASPDVTEVQRAAEEATARAEKAEAALVEIQRKQEEAQEATEIQRSIDDVAETLGSIPDGEALGRALHVLRKHDEKSYEAVRASLSGAQEIIARGGVFEEQGGEQGGSAAGKDAHEEFMRHVADYQKQKECGKVEAMTAVQRSHPDLWKQARTGESA